MQDKNFGVLKIYSFCMLYLVLMSMHAWFFWLIPSAIKSVSVVLIFAIGFYALQNYKIHIKPSICFVTISFIFYVVWNTPNNLAGILFDIANILNIVILLLFPVREKKQILNFITKWVAIILGVSACFWILNFFVKLPSLGVWDTDISGFRMENLIFFTLPENILQRIFFRFNGIFFEPGHTGMLAAFFVIANKYDFKNKYVIILSLCIIPTLSLAGYFLWLTGFILTFLYQSRFGKYKWAILSLFAILFFGYLYGINVDNGNNFVNKLIISRLEYDESKGFAGNNRTTNTLDNLYDRSVENGNILKGLDNTESNHIILHSVGNAGYKLHLLQHGIIGTFFVFIAYLSMALSADNKKWALLVLFVYIIAFWQRAYPLWSLWWITFILGIANVDFNAHRKRSAYISKSI